MNNQEANRESLLIHIEGLQATLAKRNKRIAELEQQIVELKNNPVAGAAEKAAYKKGWQAAASHLSVTIRELAFELRKIDKEAFHIYLDGEKK